MEAMLIDEGNQINLDYVSLHQGYARWAMRLKRVFNIDVTVCRHCQGSVRIIACIEDRQVINKILAHINQKQESLVQVITGLVIRSPPIDSRLLMNQ